MGTFIPPTRHASPLLANSFSRLTCTVIPYNTLPCWNPTELPHVPLRPIRFQILDERLKRPLRLHSTSLLGEEMGTGYISWQPGGYGGTACFNPKTVAGTFIYPGLG
jgi:hypothetical protein